MITAKIIEDSLSPIGVRLTTLEVTMHRFILPEFNTHRKFSRNSASSRAIPVEKQIEKIIKNPAIPAEWRSEKSGMSGGDVLSLEKILACQSAWEEALESAIEQAERLSKLGVHKSIINRILEPFMWQTVIVSSTEWSNFLTQRNSPLAQPEMRLLADSMQNALDHSKPSPVLYGGWHLPYITQRDREEAASKFELGYISAARCARVSYLTHDGRRDLGKDIQLFEKLISAQPPHLSPLEHIARPLGSTLYPFGNFDGWEQFRSYMSNEIYQKKGNSK